MTYEELQQHIVNTLPKRLPQSLYEMNRTWPLVHFLNSRYDCNYDQVIKESRFDHNGVDTTIIDTTGQNENLYVQLTRAIEYDMQPGQDHSVDISGHPIVQALGTKCEIYQTRGVITQEIILLIDGITPSMQMYELVTNPAFMEPFLSTTCFSGIYFSSDLVFELLPIKGMTPRRTA